MTDDITNCPACGGMLLTTKTVPGGYTVRFTQSCRDCDAEFSTLCDLSDPTRRRTDD